MLTKRDLEDHDAVVLVIRRPDDKILTLYHAKFGFWTLPLGKAELGQTPIQAVEAEAEEECGIDVLDAKRVCTGTRVYKLEKQTVVTFFHVYEIVEFEGIPRNMEPSKHPEMRYMSLSELRSLQKTSDGTRMFIEHLAELESQTFVPGPTFPVLLSPLGRKVRIGLSGAAGAGKTTFANFLRDKYTLEIHTEAVRSWLKRHGNLEYPSLTDSEFLKLQVDLMDSYERSAAAVFDRTPLDSVIYSVRVKHLFDYEAFCDRGMRFLRKLDVIVFFPPHPPFLKSDGVRDTNIVHQTDISSRMFVWASDHGFRDKMIVFDQDQGAQENTLKLHQFLFKNI